VKIRSYLVALVLSIFVPFTIFAGAIAYKLAEGERAASVDGLRSTARALAIAVDRNIADVSNSLKVLSSAELLRIGELEGFHRYARRIVTTRRELQRLVLVDTGGRILFDTDVPYGAPLAAEITTGALARAIATGVPALEPNIAAHSGPYRRAIAVFVPASVDGEITYALIAFLDLSIIDAIFADQKLPPDWTGVILDANALILGRSRSADVFVGQPAPPALASAISGRTEGIAHYSTQEGWPTLAGFARSGLTGWTVVLGMPSASADIGARRTLTMAILTGIAVSLLALAFAAFLGHQISRSVLGLLKPALAMAEGHTVIAAGTSKIAEIQSVTEKLVAASGVLRERERQRQRAEERYRLASLATNDIIWELNVQTSHIERSSNFYSAFGYGPDEDVSSVAWWHDHLHPEDARRVMASRASALGSKTDVWSTEYRLKRADGTFAHVLDRAYVVRGEDERARRVIGAMVDLTERKIVEQQLRQSEAHLARAQRVAALGSWELLLESGELHWSDELFRICGVDRGSFHPTLASLAALILEEDLPAARQAIDLAFAGHPPAPASLSLDLRIRRQDGEIRVLHREGEPVFDSEGTLVALIGTMQDVTAARADEARRRELEQQLRQTQKMEALGQLTGGIAHDFNNLLAVMVGNLELAVNRQRRGLLATDLDAASLRAAARGAALTRQLLAFARRQPLRPICQDLRPLVQGMARLLEPALTAKISLAFETPDEPCWAEIDGGQFEAALLNLAINARDAMPGGGVLTISLRAPAGAGDDEIEITVRDTGTGMTREVMARAFEPFFTTKDVGKGSGLGLSMVYGFVRQSGGRVELESHPGAGTTVRLLLKRAKAPVAVEEPRKSPVVSFSSVRILLVEDEADVRDTVRSMLEDLGASVIAAADGQAALDILKTDPAIDIMVTDIVMPGGMDGIALAENASAMRPGIGIAFMSGYAEFDQRTLLAIGARPFLAKPFRKLELATALGALLS
jgi:PAS domain S-box-containing protein